LIHAKYALEDAAYAIFFEVNMPRPDLNPVKKIVGFDRHMIDAIENWRGKQRPIPDLAEAIRRLVESGLASARRAGVRGKKAAKASEMAGREIDRLGDPLATDEERQLRKRRLIKGPKEFRDIRRNRPKAKG
jgi:hypothetical protein